MSTSTALSEVISNKPSGGRFYFKKIENAIKRMANRRAEDKNQSEFVHPHNAIRRGFVRQWIKKIIFPYYFRYYRAPTERSSHAHYVMYLRHKGIESGMELDICGYSSHRQ